MLLRPIAVEDGRRKTTDFRKRRIIPKSQFSVGSSTRRVRRRMSNWTAFYVGKKCSEEKLHNAVCAISRLKAHLGPHSLFRTENLTFRLRASPAFLPSGLSHPFLYTLNGDAEMSTLISLFKKTVWISLFLMLMFIRINNFYCWEKFP